MTALRQAMIKRDGIRVIPHVQEFVKGLSQAGLKLAVASSSSLAEIKVNPLCLSNFQALCLSVLPQPNKPGISEARFGIRR
jgi:beta-phosphoglucomutase-like phosphatase (HAD superfamily)